MENQVLQIVASTGDPGSVIAISKDPGRIQLSPARQEACRSCRPLETVLSLATFYRASVQAKGRSPFMVCSDGLPCRGAQRVLEKFERSWA